MRDDHTALGSSRLAGGLLVPVASGDDLARALPAGVVGPEGQPAPRRFSVYRNNVMSSLIEALGSVYPAIRGLLGEDYFKALAAEFIRGHPPRSPVLLDYGAEFAGFLEGFPPLADYPYLADTARLEWAWLKAYHAADVPGLSPACLAGVAADALGELTLRPHPAAAILMSPWPVHEIWQRNRTQDAREALPPPDLSPGDRAVLIRRPELEVEVTDLSPVEARFLTALQAGETLSGALDTVLAHEEGEADMAGLLASLATSSAFCALHRGSAC